MSEKTKVFWKVYGGIFIAMVFWSLSFIWYKQAYKYFGPLTTILLRLTVSAVILLIVSYFLGKLKIKKEHFKLFLFAAFFEPFLYFIGESYGMQMVSSVTAAVIISTIPIFTPIILAFFTDERITWVNFVGIVISTLGVMMVILNKEMVFEASLTGVLLMLVAVVSAIAYAVALRKLTPLYQPLTIVTIQNLLGAIFFFPLFFFFEKDTAIAGWNAEGLIPIFKLAIFASSIAFLFYAYSVNKIGVSKANTFTNLIPVLTSIFAYFILDETFTALKVAGIIVVVGGLFLSQVNFSKLKPVRQPKD